MLSQKHRKNSEKKLTELSPQQLKIKNINTSSPLKKKRGGLNVKKSFVSEPVKIDLTDLPLNKIETKVEELMGEVDYK